jgi:hypothetical protein
VNLVIFQKDVKGKMLIRFVKGYTFERFLYNLSTGNHYNPFNKKHGLPTDEERV